MNDKSVFKKLVCPNCRKWTPDATGKAVQECPKCRVRMQPSVKWHVRITRNGKTSVKAVSSRRQDAIDYLHAAKDAVRRGALLPGEEKPITWESAKKDFSDWIDRFNEKDDTYALSFKTREIYHLCLRHLDNHLNDDLQSITVKQVADMITELSRTLSTKYVCETVKLLKRMYSLQCGWHSARTNPELHAVAADLAKMEMPDYNNKRLRFLTVEETKVLLDNCTAPHLKLAIQIALATGWRHGMIMGLEWRQIDFINRTATFQPKDMKSGRVFVAPLMGGISVLLTEWRKLQAKKKISPFVFQSPTRKGQHMADMQTSWEKLMEACNKKLQKEGKPDFSDVCFHTLRHTFASHFLMNGGDLATLSELLDHASIQITKDRYGHLCVEHKKKEIDRFEGVFFQSSVDR
ncbi:site-specific integrase [Oryzomonas sagensis]|uniref:Site-specific integrase n=1 Tax=Oryzomonas sagensis TaxID=2603857 RepID=A0ABQ6TL30_9BACT|nr:site-specific integrase [Oryzomonas sagensis]KAB0668980.1 site-specific integrase [Oryzomonas sagensis]